MKDCEYTETKSAENEKNKEDEKRSVLERSGPVIVRDLKKLSRVGFIRVGLNAYGGGGGGFVDGGWGFGEERLGGGRRVVERNGFIGVFFGTAHFRQKVEAGSRKQEAGSAFCWRISMKRRYVLRDCCKEIRVLFWLSVLCCVVLCVLSHELEAGTWK